MDRRPKERPSTVDCQPSQRSFIHLKTELAIFHSRFSKYIVIYHENNYLSKVMCT